MKRENFYPLGKSTLKYVLLFEVILTFLTFCVLFFLPLWNGFSPFTIGITFIMFAVPIVGLILEYASSE